MLVTWLKSYRFFCAFWNPNPKKRKLARDWTRKAPLWNKPSWPQRQNHPTRNNYFRATVFAVPSATFEVVKIQVQLSNLNHHHPQQPEEVPDLRGEQGGVCVGFGGCVWVGICVCVCVCVLKSISRAWNSLPPVLKWLGPTNLKFLPIWKLPPFTLVSTTTTHKQ